MKKKMAAFFFLFHSVLKLFYSVERETGRMGLSHLYFQIYKNITLPKTISLRNMTQSLQSSRTTIVKEFLEILAVKVKSDCGLSIIL